MPPRAPHRRIVRAEPIRSGFICKIEIPDLPDQLDANPFSTLKNVEAVASYSRLDLKQPTIVVPGSPPVLTLKSVPFTTPPDPKVNHKKRCIPPTFLDPLVASVQHMRPDFPFYDVDIVCDRAFMRQLLRWSNGGETTKTKTQDFRYDVQLAGKTMLCTHRIMDDWQYWGGYGGNFEKAATSGPVEGHLLPAPLAAHDRIIQYDFGGLRLLVRYEVDACMPLDVQSQQTNPQHQPSTAATGESVATKSTPGQRIKLISGGTIADQSRIVELKSRSRKKTAGLFWNETHPQLLLSQTPLLVIGAHDSGTYSKLETHTLDEIESRRDSRGWMYRLGMALRNIYELVAAQEDGALLRIDCVDGVLKLSRRDNGEAQALPKTMLELFRPLPLSP